MTISLHNKTVLVTREIEAAEQFAEKIRTYNGNPIVAPLLEIRCIPFKLEKNLSEKFDWVFFTSVNGVNCFMRQSPQLEGCRIAAVGPKTAEALEQFGYEVDFIPTRYNAKTMAAEFLQMYENSGFVLFVRGNLSSPVLLDAFINAKRSYECVEVYETVTNEKTKVKLSASLQEEIDFITFTSPSTVDAFIQLVGESKKVPAVCIGTTTEKRAKEVGFTETIVPEDFTIEGMLEVMLEEVERKKVK